MARPPTPIDYALVERLAHIHCTDEEIATLIGMSKENFCRRKARDKQLCQCLEKGRDGGKMSLRRMQWKSAEAGNVTAQIWLGKQLLGQKDKTEQDNRGEVKVVVEHVRTPYTSAGTAPEAEGDS
jgi:hypothetical protein